FQRDLFVRVHRRTKEALDKVRARIKGDGRLTFFGKDVTQEALINASWLLLESKDVDWLVEQLGPAMAQIEALDVRSVPAVGSDGKALKAKLRRKKKPRGKDEMPPSNGGP